LARTGSYLERRGAVWAIARIGNPAGNSVLKELCNDKDEYVRKTAVSKGVQGTVY
jgi:HEAT repeat protein